MKELDAEGGASPKVFVSESEFREAYVGGLRSLMAGPARRSPGVAALVVANVANDAVARDSLGGEVASFLEALSADPDFASDALAAAASDERAVWSRIVEAGAGSLAPPRARRLGPWRLTHNALRSLRPRRLARESFDGIRRSFDADGFHFNRSELVVEAFLEQNCSGSSRTSAFYNKFPFAPAHAVLVPDRLDCREQYLTRQAFDWAWQLARDSGIDGLGIGYNALGAYASVNHLHFHMFIAPGGLPIMDSAWAHNGGSRRYPIPCAHLTTPETAWAWIAHQHLACRPYNLVFNRTGLWAVARRHQCSDAHAPWTSGFAWYELSGCLTMDSVEAMDLLAEEDIEAEFRRLV